jgi:predicted CXXCH cytochrome family protein
MKSTAALGRLVVFGALFVLSCATASAQTAGQEGTPRYVTSDACGGCHDAAMAAWRTSHHAWAWRMPSDDTVLGDFNDARFDEGGHITSFTRDGASFLVETEGQSGATETFEVTGTIGVAPLQQYLVETSQGHSQALDVAWDHLEKRWYHLYPGQALAYEDGLHWSGSYKNWNARCAECHATGYEKNYNAEDRNYTSRQAETGVGCEACHGPGEAHVAWARDPAAFDSTRWQGLNAQGLTVNFGRLGPETEIQLCAGCHSRREPLGANSPLPGTPFHDAYRLALLRAGLYHPDGQIIDEVYVYGSFLQSKMYAKGVRCSNCHEPHSGALRAAGNAVCAQCHSPAGNAEFPSLKPTDYDAPAHHFHQPGSAGSQCTSCHMIERVYMGIDGRRDHSFRVPRPDLSVALGTPNACTDCHQDKTAQWAAREVETRFPGSRHRGSHIAESLAPLWAGQVTPERLQHLFAIAADAAIAGIVRASALDALVPYASPALAREAAVFLSDPNPLVRTAAISLQQPAEPVVRLQRLAPLFQDERKSVRIEAARTTIDLSPEGLAPIPALAMQGARNEFQESLLAKADFPEAQLAMAGSRLVLRQFREAEIAFREAVRLDPQLVQAWTMIARLRMAHEDPAGAEEALQKGLEANPGDKALEDLLTALVSTSAE